MDIELIPLEKMIFNEKEILLGAKKEDVIKLLGEPEKNIWKLWWKKLETFLFWICVWL